MGKSFRLRNVIILAVAILLVGCRKQPPPTAIPSPVVVATSTVHQNTAVAPTLPPATAADAATSTASPALADTAVPATPTSEVNELFFPVVDGPQPTATSQPTVAPPPTAMPPTPIVPLNFDAVRNDLSAQGFGLAYNKIGFHIGIGGNRVGINEWMHQLDAAGVPFFLKTVDDAGPIFEAQEMIRANGVPHTLVFRRAGDGWDVPNYNLPPAEAARLHWDKHIAVFPPELDKSIVWLETMNELDKNRSEWLAEFALAEANMALRDGFKWAAFGWATGEPEVEHWESPKMLELLRLIAAHPDQLAIALHEGSLIANDVADGYPYKTGRFMFLFDVCDRNGIPRPNVFITEWGWESHSIPEPGQAMRDVDWAARLYAPFPNVKGVAIWYLGGGFDPVQDKVQRLIQPMTAYSLQTYFTAPLPPNPTSTDPSRYAP